MSSDTDDKVAELQFKELINNAAKNRFANLRHLSQYDTQTAQFYAHPQEQPWAMVKVFRGSDAAMLYLQELGALYSLRHTGRVCEVVCDSWRHDPDAWEEDFEGPYYIVKHYFTNRLDEVLEQTSDLDKLDLAAQLVDISRQFLKAGWRDWDWRVENDFVAKSGRLLRIDLDSAAPLNSLIREKSSIEEPRYFSEEERARLEEFLHVRSRLTRNSWADEVRNSAIRLAHVFCQDYQRPRLEELIKKLQAPGKGSGEKEGGAEKEVGGQEGKEVEIKKEDEVAGDAADAGGDLSRDISGTPPFLRRFKGRAGVTARRFFARVFGAETENGDVVIADEHAADANITSPTEEATEASPAKDEAKAPADDARRDEIYRAWVGLWVPRDAQHANAAHHSLDSLSRLGRDEMQILSELLYLLISEPRSGFSHDDLHASLVLLELVALRERAGFRPEPGQRAELLKDLARYTRFFELRRKPRVASRPSRKQPQPASPPPAELPKSEVKEKVTTRVIKKDQGFWRAKQKSKCEDRAVTFESQQVSVAAVIDGVSEASGFEAAELAKAELDEWFSQLRSTSLDSLAGEMRSVLLKINSRLLHEFTETNRQHQAVVAMAALLPDEEACHVVIAQAGNSHCVIYWRDGEVRFSTLKPAWETAKLGVTEDVEDWQIRVGKVKLALNGGGPETYRVRLFSDGVGDAAQARLKETPDIGDLIKEAESWPLTLKDAVGDDDWSVAGLDVVLERESAASPAPGGQDNVPTDSLPTPQDESLEAALNFNYRALEFGDEAKNFWREALGALKDFNLQAVHSKYKPVIDLVGPIIVERKETQEPLKIKETKNIPVSSVPPAEQPPKVVYQKPIDTPELKLSRRERLLIYGLLSLMLAGIIAILAFLFYNPNKTTAPSGNENAPTTVQTPTPPEVTLPTSLQKVRDELVAGRTYPVGGLPGGEDFNAEWKRPLIDLSRVIQALNGKDAKVVLIEVFAPPSRMSPTILTRTQKRAEAVKDYLLKDLRVPEGRVEVIGRGAPTSAQRAAVQKSVDASQAYMLISLQPPKQ